jgi:hypothetical protein
MCHYFMIFIILGSVSPIQKIVTHYLETNFEETKLGCVVFLIERERERERMIVLKYFVFILVFCMNCHL